MDFSKLKHDLESVYNAIYAATKDGGLPSEDDTTRFLRLSRQMLSLADEEWADQAEDFVQLAQKLQQAVKKGNAPDAIRIVDSLDDAKTYCHRTYME